MTSCKVTKWHENNGGIVTARDQGRGEREREKEREVKSVDARCFSVDRKCINYFRFYGFTI